VSQLLSGVDDRRNTSNKKGQPILRMRLKAEGRRESWARCGLLGLAVAQGFDDGAINAREIGKKQKR